MTSITDAAALEIAAKSSKVFGRRQPQPQNAMGTIVGPEDVELGKDGGGAHPWAKERAVAKGKLSPVAAAKGSVSAAKAGMDRAVADQIAVIRAEMGLTGTGLIDELANEDFEGFGICGDLCSSIGDMCKVRVHGNCCDGLVYRVVIFLATVYSLYAVQQAVVATGQYTYETSFEITMEDAIELPKVDVCVANYGPDTWFFSAIRVYVENDGNLIDRNPVTWTWEEESSWTPGSPFEFSEKDGKYAWTQSEDIASAVAGGDIDAHVTLESKYELDPHKPDEETLVEYFCINADTPPSPTAVDDYLVFRLAYQLSCLQSDGTVDTSCTGDGNSDDFDTSVGGDWDKPVIVPFLRVTDAQGEKTKHYFGVDEYTVLGLTQVSHTDEDRCTLSLTDNIFGKECDGDKTKTDRFLTSVSSFNLSPGAAGRYTKWGDGMIFSDQRVFMHMDTMQVSRTKRKEVPKGTWAGVWATLGGAAASIAVVVAIFFAPLNLEQRSPTAGAPSKPFVIGRWRLCNKKSIVRHAKRAAVSAIKKSLSEGDA